MCTSRAENAASLGPARQPSLDYNWRGRCEKLSVQVRLAFAMHVAPAQHCLDLPSLAMQSDGRVGMGCRANPVPPEAPSDARCMGAVSCAAPLHPPTTLWHTTLPVSMPSVSPTKTQEAVWLTLQPGGGAGLGVPVPLVRAGVGGHLLHGHEALEAKGPQLAAEAGVLDPAPGRLAEAGLAAVDPADANLQRLLHPPAVRQRGRRGT